MRKLGPGTIVQTIQNGLGSPEIVAPILGADRIAIGVVGGFGASIRALATQ
jgi:2-dehydropantoate 2-reductase